MMKQRTPRGRPSLALAAVALGLAVSTTAAHAAGSLPVSIGATVLSASNCKFQAGSGSALSFGSVDPSSGTNATASVTVVVRCGGSAPSATYAVTANDGLHSTGPAQRRMRHSATPTEFLTYSVTSPVSGTIPKNVNTAVVVEGTITPAQFQNAIAGSFTDTVVLTLAP